MPALYHVLPSECSFCSVICDQFAKGFCDVHAGKRPVRMAQVHVRLQVREAHGGGGASSARPPRRSNRVASTGDTVRGPGVVMGEVLAELFIFPHPMGLAMIMIMKPPLPHLK